MILSHPSQTWFPTLWISSLMNLSWLCISFLTPLLDLFTCLCKSECARPCLEVNVVSSSVMLFKQRVTQWAHSYTTTGPWLGPRLAVPLSPCRVCLSACLSACLPGCSILVMPLDHLPAHRQAADASSETHSNQASSSRPWLRLERDVLCSMRGKWNAAFKFTDCH